jgi:hypothetical protein
MLDAVRQLQVPLLAVLLLGGCAAKAARVVRARSIAAGLGPTALFPLRFRRPVMVIVCVAELSVGAGLLVTAGRLGSGVPATVIRLLTAVFFAVGIGALNELRHRRPGAGCGCFGDLSDTPVGPRTITRTGLLSAAAAATIGLPPLHMPTSPAETELWLAAGVFELALIGFLSPELNEILVRLGYSEPCELSRLPVARTLATLHASSQWRKHASQVSSADPADVWREGCWRFMVYPGVACGRRVDIVFAVYLTPRRPVIRAAVLDADTGEPKGAPEGPPGSLPLYRRF